MVDDCVADLGSGANYHIQHARRQACFLENLNQARCRQWRSGSGLENNAAAGDEGRGDLPAGIGPGEVPRRNDARYPDRLANRVGGRVDSLRWQHLASQAIALASAEVKTVDPLDHLPLRLREDRAFLSRQKRGDLIDAGAGNRGSPGNYATALRSGDSLPHRPSRLGGGDRRQGFSNLGGWKLSHYLTEIRRIDIALNLA